MLFLDFIKQIPISNSLNVLLVLSIWCLNLPAQNCSGTQNLARIHTLQGNGSSTAFEGAKVTIEGIVTGDYQTDANKINGFFVQEEMEDMDSDPNTSEGIFIFEGDHRLDVSPGDKVRVTGKVTEFFNLTEISNLERVEICPEGPFPLPEATDLLLPFSDSQSLEKYENMLVHIPQDLYVTGHSQLDRGGFLILTSQNNRLYQPTQISAPGQEAQRTLNSNNQNRIILDDGSRLQNPNPIIFPFPYFTPQNLVRGGDKVSNITGILTYSNAGWNHSEGEEAFRIHPTKTPAFSPTNPRPDGGHGLAADLIVGSFNLGNFFNGDGMGNQFPTSRGAKNYPDFVRQRKKLALAIARSQADIMGLMEIENDGFDVHSAIQDLVNATNDNISGDHYDFVHPGVNQIGSDAICVALIYKSAKVEIEPGTTPQILQKESIFSGEASNRPSLATSFVIVDTAIASFGQGLTIAVNHFKSKGMSTLDPILCAQLSSQELNCDRGDGQGYWNQIRTDAAQTLTEWLSENPTRSSSPHEIILGDLNAYKMEDPITTIESAGYIHVSPPSYSYAFNAQWGTLDYIFVSPGLANQISGSAIWHINSDEPDALDYSSQFNHPDLYAEDEFRSSDHDPVLIGLQNITVSQSEVDPIILKNQVTLFQNRPNPFKNSTYLDFYLPAPMHVRISVYDVSGKLYNVMEGFYPHGRQQVLLNLDASEKGRLWYYRLDTKSFSGIRKMVRMN